MQNSAKKLLDRYFFTLSHAKSAPISKRREIFYFIVCIITVIFVGLVDLYTGYTISLMLFYLPPIYFCALKIGKRYGIALALFSGFIWFASEVISRHPYHSYFIEYFWNAFVRIILFLFPVYIVELNKMKERLAELASFPEQNPAPIFEMTSDGNIAYINPAGKKLIPDLQRSGLNHPWFAGIEDIKDGSKSSHKDGSYSAREIKYGNKYYMQTMYHVPESFSLRIYAIDITERKHAEIGLQESEAWLYTTLKSIGDAAIATDVYGKVKFMNPVASNMTGWEEKEALGKPMEEIFVIVNEETGKPAENPIKRVLKEGVIVGLANHTVLISRSGMRYSIDDSAAPIMDEGVIIGAVLVFRDITERMKIRRALEESEKKFKALFDDASDGVLLASLDTRKFYNMNKAICRMLGYTKDELSRLGVENIHPKENLPDAIRTFEAQAMGKIKIAEALPIQRKDGSVFYADVTTSTIILGNRKYLMGIFRDITARKQAEDIKTDFLNLITHELRTPLASLRESISLVLEGRIGHVAEKQQELLYIARRSVDRLTRLINQVLDIQKANAGLVQLRIEKNNINHVVKEVNLAMLSLAQKKGLGFVLNLDENLPETNFDKDKIIEALTNIVDNAFKNTEKGSITITTAQADSFVKVSIADTGRGIKEEDIGKIFRRFVQLERKAGGTGLGLFITKQTIEAHQGKLWVESQFGRGSTFHFILPIKK